MRQKILILCQSIHHGNTFKIANVIAAALDAEVKKPAEVTPGELAHYDLLGFGSGIYDEMHHKSLLALADNLPTGTNKKAFIFSTSGVPVAILGNKFLQNYMPKAHAALKTRLLSKEYHILGEFICPGFNTNVFLKYFGGLNKTRPNQQDLTNASQFAMQLKDTL